MDLSKMLGGLDPKRAKEAVDLVLDNRDRLIATITTLPKLVGDLGGGLAEAGEQAQTAARALVGEDGNAGAQKALAASAATVAACKEQIARVGGLINGLATEIRKAPLMGGSAAKLTEGAESITGVAGQLESLMGNLTELSQMMHAVGGAMNGLGQKLTSTGGGIRELMPN